MKKIILISDTHGRKVKVEELIKNEDYDYIFFLGDGLKDFEAFEDNNKIIKVAGNCDLFSNEAKQKIVVIENIKFMLTHGHLYNAKWGIGALINEAVKINTKVVCFGHTHMQLTEKVDDIYLLNPGSLANGTYLKLDIHDGSILKIEKSFI